MFHSPPKGEVHMYQSFYFDDGINYQAKFMLMDTSGNVSEETDWVAFTKSVD